MFKKIVGLFFGSLFKNIWLSRYENYGAVKKVFILLLMSVTVAAAITCEFIAFSLFKENVVLALITCILFIALGVLAFRISLFFANIALRMAIRGTVQQGLFAKKIKQKLEDLSEQVVTEEPVIQPNVEELENESSDVVIEEGKVRYKTRGLDIAIGVIGFICAVGVVVALSIILLSRISNL